MKALQKGFISIEYSQAVNISLFSEIWPLAYLEFTEHMQNYFEYVQV